MTVTGNDLIAPRLQPGPQFEAALAAPNRSHPFGAAVAMGAFVRALGPQNGAAPVAIATVWAKGG